MPNFGPQIIGIKYMIKTNKIVAAFSGSVAMLALCGTAQAQVSLSTDGSTTLSTTAWSGSPALGLNAPNGGSSVDGNVMDSIIFQPTTSFTLGSFEFYAGSGGTGATSIGNYVLGLYNLGSSYTLPGASPLYTFTGSESDLFDTGLNFTTTSANVFNVLTFSGNDQVSLTAGNSYILTIQETSGENLILERGSGTTGTANPNFATQALGVSTAGYGNGVAVNYVPAGHRDAVGVFYAATPTPEPTSMALLGMGALLGVFSIRRRK